MLYLNSRGILNLGARTLKNPALLVRYASTSTESSKPQKKASTQMQRIPIRLLGVASNYYISPAIKNTPLKDQPMRFLKLLAGWGFSTYAIATYRWQTKKKLVLRDWKEKAVDIFVNANQGFAKKNVAPINNSLTKYVEESLQKRINALPKDIRMEWELVKLNSTPTIVNFIPIPLPSGKVIDKCQFTLRIDSTQKLTFLIPNSEVQSETKSVVQYFVFTVDPYTNDMAMAGTLFESKVSDSIRGESAFETQKEIMDSMEKSGDIFRSNA